MSSYILVTGGTGTLGRLVVPRLQDAGSKVRVLSRRGREAAEGSSPARRPARSGPGQIWLPNELWGAGPGKSSSPSG